MRHSFIPPSIRRAAVAATILVAGLAVPSIADDAPAVGTVSGTVTTSADKPAAKVVIYFFGSATQSKSGSAETFAMPAADGQAVERTPEPTHLSRRVLKGKVTTDAKGKYEIKTLKAGTYSYRAGDPTKAGMSGGEVKVEAGKTITVDIKLNPPTR